MDPNAEVLRILADVLQIDPAARGMGLDSPLLGAVPEFDSMAVVSVVTALEDSFGILVDDDEIDAATFETVGSLTSFVEAKLAG